MEKDIKIAVAGTGYVGLSIATLLSQHHHVTAVDVIPEKVTLINNRKSPIQDEYIEKLRFFKKYTDSQGTYITDRRYIEYSEIGLHYYKFDTLIKFFENFKHENGTKKALITFSKNHCLQCEPVRD